MTHAPRSNASSYRASVHYALSVLRRAANRTGAFVAARESSAQHFATVETEASFRPQLPPGYGWPPGAPWAGLFEASTANASCE